MAQQVVINSFSGIGPICILLDTNTQQTILDLKKHVTERTSIPTTFQCIKNLSGRSLKDQDSIVVDKQGGPIVFNIKITAASWKPANVLNDNNIHNQNNTPTFSNEEYHISKYSRRQDLDPLIIDKDNNKINNDNDKDHDLVNNISSPINNSTTTLTLRTATMIFSPHDSCHFQMTSTKGKSKETRKRKSHE